MSRNEKMHGNILDPIDKTTNIKIYKIGNLHQPTNKEQLLEVVIGGIEHIFKPVIRNNKLAWPISDDILILINKKDSLAKWIIYTLTPINL